MTTRPHSDPYPTGDPNKTEDERLFESALIYKSYLRGEAMDDIAKRLGLTRSVAYNRLNDLINGRQDLTRLTVRHIGYARLEDNYLTLTKAIEQADDLPAADLAKLVSERRKLAESMVRMMGANAPDTQSDDDTDLSDHENWS